MKDCEKTTDEDEDEDEDNGLQYREWLCASPLMRIQKEFSGNPPNQSNAKRGLFSASNQSESMEGRVAQHNGDIMIEYRIDMAGMNFSRMNLGI